MKWGGQRFLASWGIIKKSQKKKKKKKIRLSLIAYIRYGGSLNERRHITIQVGRSRSNSPFQQ